ncbi:unnamed protein product [Effrenium voratum]|uniref:Uncharacterized protein n=1 Tax=Effrenium voratum TaxID=2562239 RepID=A0AA36JDD8_9DINO|nr:unnamed protein product [Effrenium voratum]
MDELYDDRWQELWSQVCEAFTEEAGHEPPPSLEFWEVTLLYRLVLADFDRPTVRRAKRQLLSNATGSNSLAQLKQELQRTVQSLWRQEDAEEALAEAVELERSGQWDEAREAYAKGVFLGPSQPLQRAVRFAQLLHVMAGASEQVLHHALGGRTLGTGGTSGAPSRAKRGVMARLVLLLLQEGRDEEALALLRSGGWRFSLAPWILRYPSATDFRTDSGFPGGVWDQALPGGHLQRLQAWLDPGSAFWREHGYNEVVGSGENGYFSYVQEITEAGNKTLTGSVIRYIWKFLCSLDLFPGLGEAKLAEWWAHKRPHACGHQMHYDSDNEGIGGVRNPICSCIVFIHAPPGVGGPTLVTDQLAAALGTRGWLVDPAENRLSAYDGRYLHGVVPGAGRAPEAPEGRRVTFMVAFWKEKWRSRDTGG